MACAWQDVMKHIVLQFAGVFFLSNVPGQMAIWRKNTLTNATHFPWLKIEILCAFEIRP